MRKLYKILAVLALALVTGLSVFASACNGEEFKFSKQTPEKVTVGSEIYFREFIPVSYGAEYELYASYYDPVKKEEVKDKKLDSLMFKFDLVTEYSFKLKKVSGGKGELTCDIDVYPELPRFNEFSEYLTLKGDTMRLNDIIYWCRVSIENEKTATADVDYTYKFMDVTINSLSVDGSSVTEDLSSKTLEDYYEFSEEAIYDFNVKAINKAGEVPFTLSVNTSNTKYHMSEVSGYVYEDDGEIFFTMAQALAEDIPEDGAQVDIRLGDKKMKATYDAETLKYTVNGYDGDVDNGVPVRLFVKGPAKGRSYSVMVVAPTLVITQENVRQLELVKDGYIVLKEDIDMSKLNFTQEEIDAGKNYWGSSRSTLNYTDYRFRGFFDGQGFTIKNFTAGKKYSRYNCALFWSVEGGTIKNLIVEKATVIDWNSVITCRASSKAKFENIAVEVVSMDTENAGIITGPTENDITYKNILMYVSSLSGPLKSGASFLGGLYAQSIIPSNVFCVTDTELPLKPKDTTNILGDMPIKVSREDVINGRGITIDNMPTPELKKAFDKFFINYMTKINEDNFSELMTATAGEYWLTEDIDFNNVDLNGSGEGKGTWLHSDNFQGVLDGKGHTIKNFTGGNLFGLFNGTIKDVNFIDVNFTGSKGFLSLGTIDKNVAIENAIFTFKDIEQGSWTSLLGYQTAGVATLKNVYVDMSAVKDVVYKGFITCHAVKGLVMDKVFMVGNLPSYHSTSESNNAQYSIEYPVTSAGAEAKEGTDFFTLKTNATLKLEHEDVLPENIKDAFNAGILSYDMVAIDESNFGLLQSATGGYYKLSGNVDFNNVDLNGTESGKGTWTPTATFAGVLDGAGFTVKNFAGSNFFKGFSGEVKNINFTNIDFTGSKGFLAVDNVSKDVIVENAIFAFKKLENTNSWTSLLGYQTAGVATFKNVYIDMSTANNASFKGFITCHAVTGLVMENVFMVGNLPSYHSTSESNSAQYAIEYPLTSTGAEAKEGIDFFTLKTNAIIKFELESKLPENIKKAFTDGVLVYDITMITKQNVSTLQTATGGYFMLVDNIDMSGVTWTPTSSFAGVLDGQGKTISGLTITGNNGLFKHVVGGTIRNLNLNVKSNVNNSGAFGQIAKDGVLIEDVNVSFDKKIGYNDGLFQVIQTGTVTIKNVQIYVKEGAGSFIAGQGMTSATGKLVLDNVRMFSESASTSLIGTLVSGAVVSANPEVDYFIFKGDDVENGVSKRATAFIKSEYARLNPTA